VRQQRVLTYGTPTNTGTSALPLVIQNRDRFLPMEPGVRVPRRSGDGLGRHFQFCRKLPTDEITVEVVPGVPVAYSWAVVSKDENQRDDGEFTDG
jgi:hypothetical protein